MKAKKLRLKKPKLTTLEVTQVRDPKWDEFDKRHVGVRWVNGKQYDKCSK